MLRICAENASEPNISLLNIVELAHALRVRCGSSAAYAALNGEELRQRAYPRFRGSAGHNFRARAMRAPNEFRFVRHSGSMGSTVLTSIPSVVGRLSTSCETEATSCYPTVLVLAHVNARTYSVVCFTSRSNEAPSGHPLLKLPSRLKRRVQPCCFVKRGKSSPS